MQDEQYSPLTLPVDIEAEQVVLGSMMMDRSASAKSIEILNREDFYRPSHAIIFDALCAMFQNETPTDPITVKAELEKRGNLDQAGGFEYINNLTQWQFFASRVVYYSRIVQEKATLRRLITVGQEITEKAYTETTATAALDYATQQLLNIERAIPTEFRHIRDVASEVYDEIGRAAEVPNSPGLMTQISDLDRLTGGLASGLVIVGGRPSQGKTGLLLQVARSNAVPMAMFSYETTASQLVRRLITAKTKIGSWRMRSGKISDGEFSQIAHTIEGLYQTDLYVCDQPIEMARLSAMAKRAVIEYQVKAVLVDYIQLVRITGLPKQANREQYVSAVARALKELAQALKIPVIAAAQLSRRAVGREDGLPTLEDLRESGEIEAAADLVILIHNPKPKGVEDDGEQRAATLIVAKQKDGPTGMVPVWWRGELLTFSGKAADEQTPMAAPESDGAMSTYWHE